MESGSLRPVCLLSCESGGIQLQTGMTLAVTGLGSNISALFLSITGKGKRREGGREEDRRGAGAFWGCGCHSQFLAASCRLLAYLGDLPIPG